MSDVFVAFVREDQAFAEAIAIALQDANLQVSRSASVMDAIDQSPAVVVLWTQASSRSRLFLDAADRAFRSGKMVLARLGVAPTPAEYQAAPQHVFRTWSGDPEHSELQVVVDHVQRQVAFARNRAAAAGGMAVGAGTVHPFPQPPAQRPPQQAAPLPQPPAAPPPPYQPPQPPPQAYDPNARIIDEANFWRQIQNSANPGDFRAYLERYGPNGAFAELAGLRLQQLSTPPPAPMPPPQPAPKPAPNPGLNPGLNPGSQQARPPAYGQDPLPPYLTNRAPPGASPSAQRSGAPSRATGGLFDSAPPARRDYDRPGYERSGDPPPKSGAMMGPVLFLLIIAGLAGFGWWFLNGGSFTPGPARAPTSDVAPVTRAVDDAGGDAPTINPEPPPTGAASPPPAQTNPTNDAPPKTTPKTTPVTPPRAAAPPPARPASAPSSRPASRAEPADDPSKAAYTPPRPPSPEEIARLERERLERERLEREIDAANRGPPPAPAGPPR